MALSSDTLRQAPPILASRVVMEERFAYRVMLAVTAGYLASLGFAPHYCPLLSFSGMVLWLLILTSTSRGSFALVEGLCFGGGLYLTSMSWLYAGVQDAHAPVLAFIAPTLLILGMLLQPLVLSAAAFYLRGQMPLALLLAVPSLSVLLEWIKFQGQLPFPWLNLGNLQIPSGPFIGYAPLGGVLLICWAMWCGAGALVLMLKRRHAKLSICILGALLTISYGANCLDWTSADGARLRVGLLQGNVHNEGKFDRVRARQIVSAYENLAESIHADLIVMPETAWPLFDADIPASSIERMSDLATRNGGDVIISHLAFDPQVSGRYYSVARNIGRSGSQWYFKRQLVPFGEYIPFPAIFGPLYRQITRIQLLDTSPGFKDQAPLVLAGHRAAMRLCYEDLFGADFHEEVGPAALMVGLVNDDWFHSIEPVQQHLQVAQARAIEARKPYIRAANTGITAALDHRGSVIAQLPANVAGSIVAEIETREGLTPFIRYGNAPALIIATLSLSICGVLLQKKRGHS